MAAFASLMLLALSAQPVRGKLKAVGEQLEQERIDVQRLLEEEAPLLETIEAAARDEAEADRTLREAREKSLEVSHRLADARERERKARAEADARMAVLEPRLRVWQRLSADRRAELLLSASSAQQAERRETALRSILQRELSEMRGVLRDLRVSRSERAAVAELEADLARRSAQAERAETEAES